MKPDAWKGICVKDKRSLWPETDLMRHVYVVSGDKIRISTDRPMGRIKHQVFFKEEINSRKAKKLTRTRERLRPWRTKTTEWTPDNP